MPYTHGMNQKELLAKIEGVVFGTAVGDALGYPVEFNKSKQPLTLNNGDVSRFSDDTQMLVATLRGLVEADTVDDLDRAASAIAKYYVEWSESPENNRAPGGACMHGCRELANGVHWRAAGKLQAGGCGTAMRSMAYGIWFYDDTKKAALWAAEHATMTHRHPMAQAAAAAVAAGTAAAISGMSKSIIAQVMWQEARRYDEGTATMLNEATQEADGPENTSVFLDKWRGWAGHEAVAASLLCFLRYPSYENIVLAAVNSPGDSDSLGAISGALEGGVGGIHGIPMDWRIGIEDSGYLTILAGIVLTAMTKLRATETTEGIFA